MDASFGDCIGYTAVHEHLHTQVRYLQKHNIMLTAQIAELQAISSAVQHIMTIELAITDHFTIQSPSSTDQPLTTSAGAGYSDTEESEESEGEGDHHVESLVRDMRHGQRRWLLVKWDGLPHESDTWEPTKNLHKELVQDFDWRKGLPLALSELLELPPARPAAPAAITANEAGGVLDHMVARWWDTLRREGLLPASVYVSSDAGASAAASRRRSRTSEFPKPFAPQCESGLHKELESLKLPLDTVHRLQRAAEALRLLFELPLSAQLQLVVCRAPRAAEGDMRVPAIALASSREDRTVRVAVPAITAVTEPVTEYAELRLFLGKNTFATDSEEHLEAVADSAGKCAPIALSPASTRGGFHRDTPTPAADAGGTTGAAPPQPHPWEIGLQEAITEFDMAVDFKRLCGIDASLFAYMCTGGSSFHGSDASGDARGDARVGSACPIEASLALVAALADRNHVRDHPAVTALLKRMAGVLDGTMRSSSAAPLPAFVWANRFRRTARARVKYAALGESDPDDADEDAESDDRFVPFGTIVAVSGAFVRVSVSCAAGLAATIPIWGVRPRSDAAWAVRAMRPESVVVIQEGERALVQAQLVDADGNGVPSRERLLRAVVFALPVPLLDPAVHRAVVLQRDGALDKEQMGQEPPLRMSKKDLCLFKQRIVEHKKTLSLPHKERTDESDQLDINVIIAPGTRRRAALDALVSTRDSALDNWLEGMSDDDYEYDGSAANSVGSGDSEDDEDDSD